MSLGLEEMPPGSERVLCRPQGQRASRLTMQHITPSSSSECTLDIHADRLNQQRSCKARQLRRRKWQNRINSWNSEAENHNQNQKHSMIVGSAQCSDTIGDRVMKTQQLNNDDNSFSNPPSEEEAQCIPVVSSSHSINVSSNHHTAASQHGGSSRLSTSKESSGTLHSSSQSSYFLVSSPYLYHFLVLVLLTFAQSADCCSSRSTPKPGPVRGHNAMRPNITFQTYACPPAYAAWYCLNGATCFTVKIADSILYNCECADGYMGQRCEFKDLDGTYLPTRERLLMGMGLMGRTGSKFVPVFSAVFIIIVAAVIVSVIITKTRTKAKRARIIKQQQQTSLDTISNLDSVSSPSSVLPMRSLYSAASMDSGSYYPNETNMIVLGQSISYSLSQQSSPYSADFQGAEMRSYHRSYDNSNQSMMVQSRIPAKIKHENHLNNTR